MHLITKHIRLILLLVLPLVGYNAFGQTTHAKFNRDSSKTISLAEFNQRVDRAIMLLKTKALSTISDTDHISMMMCYNTIFMTDTKDKGTKVGELKNGDATIVMYTPIRRFSGGQYDQLFSMMDNKQYFDQIIKVYPQNAPNRGMGMFFKKIQMEWGGTPSLYAIFKVTE